LIDQFLLRYDKLWIAMARKYAHQYGVRNSDIDDAAQEVRMTVLKALKDGIPDGLGWHQALWKLSKGALAAWSARGAVTGFGGMTGHVRRRRGLFAMSHLDGKDEVSSEAIAAWNQRVSTSRTNPKRQGALATLDDLVEHQIVLSDTMETSTNPDDADDLGNLLGSMASDELIEVIVDACTTQLSELAGRMAREWLEGEMRDEPLNCSALARQLGVPRSVILRLIGSVKQVAREAARQYWLS